MTKIKKKKLLYRYYGPTDI
uniref:Uncharacterized protein n=1 Tax=Rhizophora mucronata TaxID=61149 RepID=A0A2P2PGP3_RHIMU